MTNETSSKITFLSFICIIMVVIIHSGNLPYMYNGFDASQKWSFAHIIEIALSAGIARIAVPFFFVISGYLFFYNVMDSNISVWFHSKAKSRIASLMIPYLLWSTIWLIIMLLIHKSHTYLGDGTGIIHIIKVIVVNPVNGQMWYIRDLMILTLISPLIYIITKYYAKAYITLVTFNWFLGVYNFLDLDLAVCFFSIGCFIAIHKDDSQYYASFISKHVNKLLVIFVIGVILHTAYVYIRYHDLEHYEDICLRFIILVGIMVLWFCDGLYRIQLESFSKTVFAKMVFLIFVAHSPTVRIIGRRLMELFGASELSVLLAYFLSPVITISLVVIIGVVVKRRTSPVYLVLTGGR